MKKVFKLVDLDCAHCAQKMQDAVAAISGVNDVQVNFLAQKMTLDADDARFDDIMQQVVRTCKKIEPDCRIKL